MTGVFCQRAFIYILNRTIPLSAKPMAHGPKHDLKMSF